MLQTHLVGLEPSAFHSVLVGGMAIWDKVHWLKIINMYETFN